MTSTTMPLIVPRGALIEQLAMRGGLALVSWSLHRADHRPDVHLQAAQEAREQAALRERALLLPVL